MAGKAKIGAVIALDGEKEFRSAVTGCNKELTNLRSESKLVKEQFEGQSNSLEALRAKHEVLEKTLEAHKKKVEETNKGLKNAREVYDKMGNGIQDLEDLYKKATSQMALMESASGTTKEALEEQKKEVERLSKNLEKSKENYQKAGARMQEWETKLNNAKAGLIKANRELATNEKYLNEAKRSTDSCAKSIDAYGKKEKENIDVTLELGEALKGAFAEVALSKIADGLEEVAQKTVGLATGMESAEKQIEASTGATATQMTKYKDILMDVYKNNYGDSLDDVAEAVSNITQNMGELNNVELKNITEDAIALRDTFGFDYQEQLRSVKMLMDTFSISSEKAYNLIAQGAQKGLNKNGDLLDTINEYAVHYKQMGASAEDFFNSLANGTASGTFSVDKLGDTYKEFGIRVKDTANTTTEGFELLGMNADGMRAKFVAGGESARIATNEVITALFNMDDQVKQNQAGVDLFGTMWEDLGKEGVQALMNLNGEISIANDTLTSIKDIKYDDVGNQISQIGRTIQVKFAEPLAKDILPKVAEGLEVVGDNLDVITTATVGLGSAIAVYKVGKSEWFGGIISGLKKMKTAMVATTTATTGATTATKLFNAVCSMSPLGKVLTVITAVTAALATFKVITNVSNSELIKEHKEIEKIKKEMEGLTETIIENKEQRQAAIESTEAEWLAYQNMSNMLYNLAESEENSAEKKAKMKILVEQLNEEIPELNLAIDEQTGALNLNKAAVDSVIASMKEKAVVAIMEEQLTEIMKEQAQAYLEVTNAELEKEKLDTKVKDICKELGLAYDGTTESLIRNMYAVNDASIEGGRYATELAIMADDMEKLDKAIEEGNEIIEKGNVELNLHMEAMEKVSESLGTTTSATKEMEGVTEKATTTVSEAYKKQKEALEESLRNTVDLFHKFNGGQEITTKEMLDNLESQKKGLQTWKDNMQILAAQAGKGMSENLFEYLSQMGPQGANAVNALAGALREGSGEFERICAEWEAVLSIENQAVTLIPEYYETGRNMTASLKKGIEDETPEVVTAATAMTRSVIWAVKTEAQIKSPSRVFRNEIGKMLALGMAAGIIDGTGEVEDSAVEMCESVVKVAVKKLDIHSPSRVFRDGIGAMIAAGVAEGVRKETRQVKRANQEMTIVIYKEAENQLKNLKAKTSVSLKEEKKYWTEVRRYLKKGSKEYEEASEKIRNLDFSIDVSKQGNFGISKKDAEGNIKTAEVYSGEVLAAATSWLGSYGKQQELTAEKEVQFWKQIRKELQKGTAAYNEATQNIETAKKAAAQEKLSASDTALSQYKVYYQVSAKAEIQYWNIVRKQFKKGTDERIEADKKYYEAKENLNSQLEELNEEYVQNCADVQEKLKADIQELTDAYNEAVEERADAIYSSFGLFDEFKSESESGAKLLYNLKTQVAGIADWELQLRELASRGLPTDLIEELQAMGPEASASLHALNSLTDEQLKEYTALWEQKHALADSQAVSELEPMRKETQEQIKELTATAKKELAALKTEYKAAVKELNTGISTALKNLASSTQKVGVDATAALVNAIKKGAEKKDTTVKLKSATTTIKKGLSKLPKAAKTIGSNTLEGIVEGLTDKKKMSKSAKAFVEELKKEIQKAAGIHSPSRLFKKEIGVQLSAGVEEGITEEQDNVSGAGTEMINKLLANTKQQLAQQQDVLKNYIGNVNNGTGLLELQNLISVAPVQQVNATVDTSGLMTIMSEMILVMQQGFEDMKNMQLVTDTGAVIGETSSGMSVEFAKMMRRMR